VDDTPSPEACGRTTGSPESPHLSLLRGQRGRVNGQSPNACGGGARPPEADCSTSWRAGLWRPVGQEALVVRCGDLVIGGQTMAVQGIQWSHTVGQSAGVLKGNHPTSPQANNRPLRTRSPGTRTHVVAAIICVAHVPTRKRRRQTRRDETNRARVTDRPPARFRQQETASVNLQPHLRHHRRRGQPVGRTLVQDETSKPLRKVGHRNEHRNAHTLRAFGRSIVAEPCSSTQDLGRDYQASPRTGLTPAGRLELIASTSCRTSSPHDAETVSAHSSFAELAMAPVRCSAFAWMQGNGWCAAPRILECPISR